MHDILMVAVIALVTMSTRFLPFLIFRENHQTPKIITYLGKVLPCAIMGMLVVYCMKDVVFLAYPYGLPELIGCTVVAVLHIWKRNSLLSIGVGTVCYMLLVQLVF
ncbi:MAG: branched-chain amino acid transporter permease [Oscillospiraceae bacterium]|nr:branched-chain amino acid transporter permease [Oscillospiraceae bacterium]